MLTLDITSTRRSSDQFGRTAFSERRAPDPPSSESCTCQESASDMPLWPASLQAYRSQSCCPAVLEIYASTSVNLTTQPLAPLQDPVPPNAADTAHPECYSMLAGRDTHHLTGNERAAVLQQRQQRFAADHAVHLDGATSGCLVSARWRQWVRLQHEHWSEMAQDWNTARMCSGCVVLRTENCSRAVEEQHCWPRKPGYPGQQVRMPHLSIICQVTEWGVCCRQVMMSPTCATGGSDTRYVFMTSCTCNL